MRTVTNKITAARYRGGWRRAAILTATALAAFMLLLPGQNGAAALDYYFLMLNGQQQSIDLETMPMKIDGRVYVAVGAFEKIGAKCRYDGEAYVLIVESDTQKLRFDTRDGGVWDQNSTKFTISCLKRGSVYYVPAEFTANMLGYSYNFHSNLNFIRLASRREPYMDYDYYIPFIIENLMNEFYSQFAAPPSDTGNTGQKPPDETGEVSQFPPPPVVPDRPGVPVYITLERVGAEDMGGVLDLLGQKGLKALFFMTMDEMASMGAVVNRIIAEKHQIGVLVELGMMRALQSSSSSPATRCSKGWPKPRPAFARSKEQALLTGESLCALPRITGFAYGITIYL